MPLAAPRACNDLGPLLLGEQPLDRQEHVSVRALAQGPMETNDLDPCATPLVHAQHLRGIVARQAGCVLPAALREI
jgi:hypothetical protein